MSTNAPAAGAYADYKRQLELEWQEKIARALGIPGLIVTANVELAENGHAARQVSASLAVPYEHFAYLWQQQHGSPPVGHALRPDPAAFAALEQSESERIRQAIVPLLVAADSVTDRQSLVAVSTIYASAPLPVSAPSWEQQALDWVIQNWQFAAIASLAVVALIVWCVPFRTASKTASKPAAAPQLDAQSLYLVTEDAHEPPSRAPIPPPHMPVDARRAELAEMIRQDPEAAASVLRTWIGNAS